MRLALTIAIAVTSGTLGYLVSGLVEAARREASVGRLKLEVLQRERQLHDITKRAFTAMNEYVQLQQQRRVR